jgi:hypothetical protein
MADANERDGLETYSTRVLMDEVQARCPNLVAAFHVVRQDGKGYNTIFTIKGCAFTASGLIRLLRKASDKQITDGFLDPTNTEYDDTNFDGGEDLLGDDNDG